MACLVFIVKFTGKIVLFQFSVTRRKDEQAERVDGNRVQPLKKGEKESEVDVNQKQSDFLAQQKELLKNLEAELTEHPVSSTSVASTLEKFLVWLPGECTPQKYAGVDCLSDGAGVFAQYMYGQVFNVFVNNFISDGILKKNEYCKSLFFIFLEYGYLEENINCLVNKMNESDTPKVKIIVDLIGKLIRSHSVLSFLLRHCSQAYSMKDQVALFDETVRLYVSLPDRVANKLQKLTPEYLMPHMFCKITSYHILQAIFCVADGLHNEVSGSAEPIAKLFGRMCHISDSEATLMPIVQWLKVWGEQDLVIQRVVQKMFTHIPDIAFEKLISTLLRMEVDDAMLYVLLGDCGIQNSKLKYLLTQKFLITRQLPFSLSVPTIIRYLGRAQSSHENLRALFRHLLDVWCDKSIMTHNSFEHHTNITRGLMATTALFTNADVESCKISAIECMLHGVANHLDFPSYQFKLIGMVTAEELTKVFHAGGPTLEFEYKETELTLELKSLAKPPAANPGVSLNVKSEWMEDFEKELIDVGILKDDNPSQKIDSVEVKPACDLGRKSSKSSQIEGDNISVGIISDETNDSDDLDSDDDEFQPYDMSSDTHQLKVKEPSYPQEILDYVIEGEVDKVDAALRVSEKVIRKDLKKQDSELAVELTKVLLHLEDKYNLDGFNDKRMNTLTALTSSHPKQCALYLGGEFYERNYNMRQRLDVLHTLSRSALELSGMDSDTSCALISSTSKKKAVTQKNVMKEVAGYFFFPLVQGLPFVQPHLDLMGSDRFLLCDLLRTLGLIVGATGQSDNSLKMAGCLLELTWSLRTHEDSDVRSACLEALSSGLEVVPDSVLLSLVPGEVVELRQWLAMTVEKDTDKKCQLLAVKLALRLDKCFKEQLGFSQA